jgi:hypothetical protein
MPGATEAGLAFSEEAYGARAAELAASRAARGITKEEVFPLQTPRSSTGERSIEELGDFIVVYGESEDPEAADKAFAESQAPFDRWFKDRLRTIFPPVIDFDQPVGTDR